MSHILIVDDNPVILEYIEDIIKTTDHTAVKCRDGRSALEAFLTDIFDLVISDLAMPGMDGFELISRIRGYDTDVPIIMITGVGGVDSAVKAIKQGASDFVIKPFQAEEFRVKIDKNLEYYGLRKQVEKLRQINERMGGIDQIIGESPVMKKLLATIRQVAQSNASLMILGESGTGKELLSRAVHEVSDRYDKPFIAIDCSTLTESIIESELFGHVKGAFTGADKAKKGLLEEANGGTIFLDEIGNLSWNTQSKLLRFLQEREIKPVGSSKIIKINVRIVSATNLNLRREIEKGTFREDLYYRLSGIEINVPPLRERLEDLPILAGHFIRKYSRDTGKKIDFIEPEALEILKNRNWSGNIRELEHMIEYALIVEKKNHISTGTILHILPEVRESGEGEVTRTDLGEAMALYEKNHILKVLRMANNNRSRAAAMLGISRSVLYDKLKRYEIE